MKIPWLTRPHEQLSNEVHTLTQQNQTLQERVTQLEWMLLQQRRAHVRVVERFWAKPIWGTGYVYLLRNKAGVYKIGQSRNMISRLQTLQRRDGYTLELIHTIETNNPKKAEGHFHHRYWDKHIDGDGELFALTDADVRELCEIETWTVDEAIRRNA